MKTTSIFLLTGLILFLSCNKEPEDQPETSFRIKRTLHYGDFLDTIPVHIKEFKYDHKNRIEYIYQYSKFNNFSAYYIYESFLYNDCDFLMKKITFHRTTDSWMLVDSTIYEYNGNLTSEITYFYNGGTNAYKYLYDHSKVIEKRHYYLSKFIKLIKYEYLEELCRREFEYNDSLGLEMIIYTLHNYNDNNALSKTKKFLKIDDCNFNNITYTYDANGNLILAESVQDLDCGLVKSFAYKTRYEYEEYQVIK